MEEEAVKIYSSLTPSRAELVRAGLASAGIPSQVMGEDLAGVVGGVPWVEAEVSILVAARDADDARKVIAEMEDEKKRLADSPNWTCPTCGESLEAVFTECWKCCKD